MADDSSPESWEVGDDPAISADADTVSTRPQRNDRRAVLRERRWRWTFAGVLTVFLALGAVGVFGVRSATSSSTGGGYDLEVTYGAVSRGGLATPFEIAVTRRDGEPLEQPVTIAVASDYLAMFDENGIVPAPSTETSTADEVVWEFEPPSTGATLTVTLDVRVEPGVQWGRDGSVRLLDGDAQLAEVQFRTWVAP